MKVKKTKKLSDIIFVKLCQRVGKYIYHSLKMEVVAWHQSTHLLFVQLVFIQSPEDKTKRGLERTLQVP